MSPGLIAVYVALALLALAAVLGARRRDARTRRERRCALYHIPGPDGRALRIGITIDPATREGQYRREAWWWYQRTGPLTVRRWYPSEADAHREEIRAIGRERPPHNDRHNPDRRRGHATPVPPRAAHRYPSGRALHPGRRSVDQPIPPLRAGRQAR